MKTFSEWLEQRISEGSLGLKRRQRVAQGMANRRDAIDLAYPNPSDSMGHYAGGELESDVAHAAGRFTAADERMQDRSANRIAKIAKGDKAARQMLSGRGNLDAIRANATASTDTLHSMANYDNPETLAKRGVDPNWRAYGSSVKDRFGHTYPSRHEEEPTRFQKGYDDARQRRLAGQEAEKKALARKAEMEREARKAAATREPMRMIPPAEAV